MTMTKRSRQQQRQRQHHHNKIAPGRINLRLPVLLLLLILLQQAPKTLSTNIDRSKLEIKKNEEQQHVIRTPPTNPPNNNDNDDNTGSDTTHENIENDNCRCGEEDDNNNEELARIAYAISVHNDRTMQDAVYLFRTIRSSTSSIIIHIDTKYPNYKENFPKTQLYNEIHTCACGSIIHYDSIHSSTWGEWSMNEPTHWTMDVLINHPKFKHKWDVYINLSGDSLPVYRNKIIRKLLGTTLKNINFITSSGCETGLLPTNVYDFPKFWHKRGHYTEEESIAMPNITYYVDYNIHNNINKGAGKIKKIKSKVITTYFGSQWMVLTYEFINYLILSLSNPLSLPYKYKEYLIQKQRLMTDETFIPSIIYSEFSHTLPKTMQDNKNSFAGNNGRLNTYPYLYAIRYERMDEHVPKILSAWYPTDSHYNPTKSSNIPASRIWGPYYLGVYDLHNIKKSGALFIRKVSYSVDKNMYKILPVEKVDDIPDIEWVELNISNVPDWEMEKKKLIEKATIAKRRKEEKEEEKRNRGIVQETYYEGEEEYEENTVGDDGEI